MKQGDYVKIGDGRKVYQVCAVSWIHDERVHKLAATADHPDAAVREQDAFAWYPADRLTLVRRR
jgi:hypothetical protein